MRPPFEMSCLRWQLMPPLRLREILQDHACPVQIEDASVFQQRRRSWFIVSFKTRPFPCVSWLRKGSPRSRAQLFRFSVSTARERNLYELIGDSCALYARTPDERTTLTAYCLQKLFRRAVFDMEVRRCGIEATVEGRKATPEERSEAKVILTRLGYKIPNSDVPTVVEKDLDGLFLQVLADVVVARFNAHPYLKHTTQTKL